MKCFLFHAICKKISYIKYPFIEFFMQPMNMAKKNNFSPTFSRAYKLEQKSANNIPKHLSFTQSSSKLMDPKRQHRIPQTHPQLSGIPQKQSHNKTSSDDKSSSKLNQVRHKPLTTTLFTLPPIDRSKNSLLPTFQNMYLPLPLPKTSLTNSEKASMIREINLKIELLQSKSKQPGLRLQDLNPLRQEIYNKFDQYYITNRQNHSRFIDSDPNQPNQKITARLSRGRKQSKDLSVRLKIDSNTSSPRSSLSQQSSSQEKSKPQSSKVFHSFGNEDKVNRKTYQTIANISIVSLTNRSDNQEEQERPLFETQLSQKEMIQLDRQPLRKMSEYDEEGHHDSYIQLKQNVRIMEERIGFLIHRLEENKKEITSFKEGKERMEKHCAEQQKQRQKMNEEKNELDNTVFAIQNESKKMRQKFEQTEKQNAKLEKQALKYQTVISQLTYQIQYLTQKLKIKENEFKIMEDLLSHKKTECEQLGHNLRFAQRQFTKKRKEFLSEIQAKDHESQQLKSQLKQQKARMQIEGINFKFEEAAKLKKYIEENELLHQRQILELDSSYSLVINNFQKENRRIKNQKIQLQNALIEWLGQHHRFDIQEKHQSILFSSNLIKLEAVQLKFGELSGDQISSQLINLLQNYSQLQKETIQNVALIEKLQERIAILKEQYTSVFQKKCDQIENNQKKVEQLTNMNKLLYQQKQELQQQLKQVKQQINKPAISKKPNNQLQFLVIQYRYPEPQLELIDSGTTFEKILNKMSKSNLKRKLQIILKLVDLALSFNGKKKLPTLNPSCLIVQFIQQSNDFQLDINNNKQNQDQNLHYCSPQVLLGFNQTHQSHCWTIGIILDRLIHGKQYFSQYSEIISRNENYMIRDEKYKSLDFLNDMLRKNQRQRISLKEVKLKINNFLAISHLQ